LSSPPPIFVPIPRFLCLTTWFIHSFMIMAMLDFILHKRRMLGFLCFFYLEMTFWVSGNKECCGEETSRKKNKAN
jgi:hypothetical protein